MISHYPLATLLPWPAGTQQQCPQLDCSLLLDGEGGVALQRYQPRSPESSRRHWVSQQAHGAAVIPLSSPPLPSLLYHPVPLSELPWEGQVLPVQTLFGAEGPDRGQLCRLKLGIILKKQLEFFFFLSLLQGLFVCRTCSQIVRK